MARAPGRATIRSYNVGFGDCFLLSLDYAPGAEKHVLIDFGSTALPEGAPATRMKDIAEDIRERTGGKLTAVVATHRHKDHISGFATARNGKGPGDIIRSLKPSIVIQPWTEDPDLAPEAEGPRLRGGARRIAALSDMQAIAGQALKEARRSRSLPKEVRDQLSFLGDDNIANRSAVENLMTMAPNRYVFTGSTPGLARLLPGVKVDVLGPPTVRQTDTIKSQRSKDADEFWHFQALAMGGAAQGAAALFPKHVRSRGRSFPVEARWLIYHARRVRGEQLLQIVRALDAAMNNTSVVLLFRVGKKSLLFPGDAQIENWRFALDQPKYQALLREVDLYKVGHHGSLNATPRSLWELFAHRSGDRDAPGRLKSIVSTMPGKHGSEARATEVPRKTLVSALGRETDFFSTEELGPNDLFRDTSVEF